MPHSARKVFVDSDDELMMEVMQEDKAEAAAHLQRWNMGFAFLLQLRQQMENAIPCRGGSVLGKAPNKNRSRDTSACCCAPTILQTIP
jgi:hypothetical protein